MSAKDLRLVRVATQEQRKEFTHITKTFHSYVPQPITVGRQINYLIESDGKVVGNIGLGQAPNFASHTVMDFFKLPNQKAFVPLIAHVGNLWRMTLTNDVPINGASRILSVYVHLSPKDWKEKYGDEIGWIMTFTGEEKKGTIYRASGWINIGKSAGIIIKGRGYSSFHGSKAGNRGTYTEEQGPKKDIWMKVLPNHSKELEALLLKQQQSGSGKVVEKTTPQAVVVQSSIPSVQGGDGVRNDPTAPLSKKYHLEKKNGKMVIVWEKL